VGVSSSQLKIGQGVRKKQARHRWLTPIVLTTQEAEIKGSQPWANGSKDPISKKKKKKKKRLAK
jgi:hypothetical protein